MTQLAGAPATRVSRMEMRCRRWLANAPRGQFWFFFIAAVFFNFGFSAFFFLYNIYLLNFGMTERFLGLLGSCMAIGSILGTIPVGAIAQRFGLRATLTGGVLLVIVFSALRTCIISQPTQLVLAVCSGLTLCTWAVCLSPSVAALTAERERPVAFSLMFASGIGVAGLGAFAAGRLPGWIRALPLAFSLTPVRATGAALLLVCGIAALALIPISRLTLRPTHSEIRLPRLSNPFLRRFLPAMAIWGLVTGSFAPFANVYFVHHLGLSLERAGSVFSFSNLAQFIAVLCAPLLFRRTGLSSGIMLTQLATAAALASLAIAHTGFQAATLYWAYMAVQSMNEPGIYSLLMDRIPAVEHNSASAATFFVTGGAQAAASLAMGYAIVRYGYPAALVVVAVLAVVAAILFGRLSKTRLHVPDHVI